MAAKLSALAGRIGPPSRVTSGPMPRSGRRISSAQAGTAMVRRDVADFGFSSMTVPLWS